MHTFILVQRPEDQKSFEVSLDREFEVSLNYKSLLQNKEIMKHLVFYDGSALCYSYFDSIIVKISELTLVLMTWEHSSNVHHLVAATEHNVLASGFRTKGWGERENSSGSVPDGSSKFPEVNFSSCQWMTELPPKDLPPLREQSLSPPWARIS